HLHGDTRIAKALTLVQHCLSHNSLPQLGTQCRQLRPTVNWPDLATLTAEITTVQAAIAAQEPLTDILPADQLTAMLTPLRQKEADLLTQLIGSGAVTAASAYGEGAKAAGERGVITEQAENIVTGDNNHIGNIVNNYREGNNGRIPDKQLRQAIAAYVRWVDKSYGRIRLRGLSDREHEIPDPDLPDVYVSLVAQQEARQWQKTEREQQPIDMSSLLAQGNRLVITGAPGSGKTTFLSLIAHLLARAIYTGDETAVRQQLNIDGQLPLPIYLSLGDYHRYKQQPDTGTLIDFISYTLIQQHGVYNLPKDFFAQILSRKSSVCLLLDSLDEIPDENGRSQAVKDVIDLADNDIGQIIVASRDHAYVGRVMLPSAFHRFIVQPMRAAQIAALTERWCGAVYPTQIALDEAGKLQDEIAALEAIRKEQGELPLVDTPLMVTIVAIVHWNNRVLPQQRAALYEKCVAALLAEQHKEDEGQGQSRP
ncbi:MAG: NACHT domain-containing protein, partial [Chloroflexi bacterium]|nr:NACHT domain-containing protein [Chloroflexota bacterium]